jgi:hypothetical protein
MRSGAALISQWPNDGCGLISIDVKVEASSVT